MGNEMTRSKRLFGKNAVSGGTWVIPATTVTGNGILSAIPAGYMCELIIIHNAGTADATIDLGTAALGNQLIDDLVIVASTIQSPQFNYIPDGLVAFSVYISSASWVNVSLNVYLLLRKVL